MDDNLSRAVAETFCRLHEDGVIYRAKRLVNWCVRLNTTLSNLEVGFPMVCYRKARMLTLRRSIKNSFRAEPFSTSLATTRRRSSSLV